MKKMNYESFVENMYEVMDMSELTPECQKDLIDIAWWKYSEGKYSFVDITVYFAELVLDEISAVRGC